MNKLQNDFTTPEQSKRLLELEVPIDSANCYLTRFGIDEDWEVKVLNNVKYSEIAISNQEYCLPCWSVGRLINIMNICSIHNIVSIYRTDRDVTQIDIIIETIINRINGNSIDFSKLEE